MNKPVYRRPTLILFSRSSRVAFNGLPGVTISNPNFPRFAWFLYSRSTETDLTFNAAMHLTVSRWSRILLYQVLRTLGSSWATLVLLPALRVKKVRELNAPRTSLTSN